MKTQLSSWDFFLLYLFIRKNMCGWFVLENNKDKEFYDASLEKKAFLVRVIDGSIVAWVSHAYGVSEEESLDYPSAGVYYYAKIIGKKTEDFLYSEIGSDLDIIKLKVDVRLSELCNEINSLTG